MEYQYKVVPFKGSIEQGASVENIASQLEQVINQYASQGWEFCQVGDVDIEVRPGCIAGLLGAKVGYVRHDQVIFRKAK